MMQALDQLSNKLNTLLKRYSALEAENTRLKDAIAKHVKTEEKLNKKLAALEQNMAGVNLGSTVTGDEEKQHMREQLDNVITEIDRILNTLND